MQVLAAPVGVDEPLVTGQVRHDAHFDLRVVGGDQALVALAGDERRSNLAAELGAHRDVLQVRLGRRQTAGRGDGLVERRVNSPVLADGLDQPLDGRLHLLRLAERHQPLQERVIVGLGQVLQLLGGGGVARLRLLGLRHAQLVEKHLLQLFRRPQIQLRPVDDPARRVLGRGLRLRRLVAQGLELGDVHRDPGTLHPRQNRRERHLDVRVDVVKPIGVEFRGQRTREIEHRDGAVGVAGAGLVEQRQLALRLRQRAVEVPLQDVVQRVTALAGPQEVRGQERVVDDAGQLQLMAPQGMHGRLRIVDHLRVVAGEPFGQRCGVARHQPGRVDDDGGDGGRCGGFVGVGCIVGGRLLLMLRRGDGQLPAGVVDGRGAAAGGEPPRQRTIVEALHDHLGAGVALGSGDARAFDGQGAEHPVAEAVAELEAVEEVGDALSVGRPQFQLTGTVGQGKILDHLGEVAVHLHGGDSLAQVVADLASDLVDAVDELGQAAVLQDPLLRRLLAHARDTGQIVRRVAAQRGEIRVLRRRQSVLLLHRFRREAMERRHAAHGVEDGRRVVDELQGVAVTGDDERLEALRQRLGGQRGDDVVGLVVLLLQRDDAHFLEHLLQQRHLAAELLGGLLALGLVVGELVRAEGLAADVERDGDVGGLLFRQEVRQHGQEPVHRVGELPAGGGEVVGGQREEGPEGHGVAVDEHEGSFHADQCRKTRRRGDRPHRRRCRRPLTADPRLI